MTDTSFLEWPFFDEEHKELARQAQLWAAEHVGNETIDEHDETAVDDECRRLVGLLGAAGWLEYCVPAPFGGKSRRVDVRSLCLLRETFGQYSGLVDFAFAMQGLGSGPISFYGSDEQRARFLPQVARGEQIMGFALSERDAGSDVAALRTTARRDGQDYVVNGEKTWISNGGIADVYVLFARTGSSESGSRGISAFVVEGGAPGFAIKDRIHVIAPHPLATITFTDCRIPSENRLGEEGQGFRIAMGTLDVFRSSVGAAALGFARRALAEAISRTQNRHAFGQPLAQFQLVQERLADMALGIDASALLIYRAAWTKDRGADRVTKEAAMAKLFATETAQQVVDSAVQLLGGMGVVSGGAVERLYREVRALRIYEGASDIQKLIIAAQLLRKPSE